MNANGSLRSDGQLAAVAVWGALLFGLTGIGVLPFLISGQGLDQAKASGTFSNATFAGILLTAYAPTIAALVTVMVLPRQGGLRQCLRQLGGGSAGVLWYLLVFAAPIGIVLAADGINVLLGGAAPPAWFAVPKNFATAAIWGPLVAGCLGEEPAWRGFALPRLSSHFGALGASVAIGLLWGTWHLWPALTPGGASHLSVANLTQTYVRMVSTSILYAWLFNSTKGSLILVMAAHAGHNLAIDLIPLPDASLVPVIIALLYLAAAVAVILTTSPRTLTRSQSAA